MKTRVVLCLAFAIPALRAFAQDGFPISTDRPSYSDGTGIIPKGRWQLETGYTFTKVDRAEFQSIGELLLRFPLHERVELRLINIGFGRSNAAGGGAQGLLDPSIGVKYRFQTGVAGKLPDLALVAQTSLPMGSDDFRVRRNQPSVRISGYQQLNSVNGVGAEVGYSHLGSSSSSFHQWTFSGYWTRTFNGKTAGFAEVYHVTPTSAGGPHATFVDAGVTYLLDKATQIDFRVGSGLSQRRDGWFVGAGIAFRF